MGYYTKYSLDEVVGDRDAMICVLLSEFSVDLRHRYHDNWWYDHEEDISVAIVRAGVSRAVLHLEGEERNDACDKEFLMDYTTGLVKIRRFKGRWVRDAEPTP